MSKNNSKEDQSKSPPKIPEELYTPTGTTNVSYDAHNLSGQNPAINVSGRSTRGRVSETEINLQANEIERRADMLKQHKKKEEKDH